MPNDPYLKALQKVMRNDNPARPTSRSRAEIEGDIAEISAMLRGSLPNSERLCLIEERVELRKQLAQAVA
jgi:hypothetical protein